MDREAWYAAVHGVTKSWTRLNSQTEMMWALNSYDLEIHSLYPVPIQMCPSGFQISGQTVTLLLPHNSECRIKSRRSVLQCWAPLMLTLCPRIYCYRELWSSNSGKLEDPKHEIFPQNDNMSLEPKTLFPLSSCLSFQLIYFILLPQITKLTWRNEYC